MNPFDLTGKRAFIPGGYGGIGEAVALGLAEAGAAITVAGRNSGKAQALAKKLAAAGHTAHGIALDAQKVASIRSAVDAAASRSTCFRCARSSACAASAIPPTARPRAPW